MPKTNLSNCFKPRRSQVLAAAARQIDRHLMTAPGAFGESRYDTIRIGFVYPLGIQFEVMDDVRTVVVHDIWRIDRKKEDGTP